MSDTKKLISELDKKVEQLLSNIKKQKTNLESKTKEVDELSKKLSDSESQIKNIKASNEALKVAPVESGNDSDDMKDRISELVREIDNCISLLKV